MATMPAVALAISVALPCVCLSLATTEIVRAEQKISSGVGAFTSSLTDNSSFGSAAALLGDVDLDGIPDILIGAPGDNDGGLSRGAVYLLFLEFNGVVRAEHKFSSTSLSLLAGLKDGDSFGCSVSGVGDLNADGVPDAAVGACFAGDGGDARGAIYILFLSPYGTVKSVQKISSNEGSFVGPLGDYDRFGTSIAALGDVNKDGVEDLLVGAPGDDENGAESGATYVIFLTPNGTVRAQQKYPFTSNTPGERHHSFGRSMTSLGDLDGNGVSDVLVGVLGPTGGSILALFLDKDGMVEAQQTVFTEAPYSSSRAVARLGDLDGNGVPEVLVGTDEDYDGGFRRGAVHILFLLASGRSLTVRTSIKVSSTTGGLRMPLHNGARFGSAVAGIGDLNRDGTPDAIVGCQGSAEALALFFRSDVLHPPTTLVPTTTTTLTTTTTSNITVAKAVRTNAASPTASFQAWFSAVLLGAFSM